MKAITKSTIVTLMVALGLLLGLSHGYARTLNDKVPTYKDPSSAHFDISGSVTAGGQSVPITGSGAISGKNSQEDITVTIPSTPGSTGPSGQQTLSVRLVDGKSYIKGEAFTGSPDKWYVIDSSAPMSSLGSTGLTGPGGLLDSSVTTTQIGKETINGAPTTGYRLDIDTSNLLGSLGTTGTTGTTGQTPTIKEAVYMYVGDSDMYIHRLRVTLNVSDASNTTASTLSNLSVELTLTYKDFDTAITIEAPANAEVLDLGSSTAFPGMVSGSGILGMPGMPTISGGTAGMPRTGDPGTGVQIGIIIAGCLITLGALIKKLTTRKQL